MNDPLTISKQNPPRIIVSLDLDNKYQVEHLIKEFDPNSCILKVGKQLFTTLGPSIVQYLVEAGYKVFLDLKFHDIPNTVYHAIKAAANLGIWMINVHTLGGIKMLEHARQAINESSKRPLLIGVTLLTSHDQSEISTIGFTDSTNDVAVRLAKLAFSANLDGVVCSVHEANIIKKNTSPNFITVCPGIRLNNSIKDDQARIADPRFAVTHGADYLVIGRPITQSKHPNSTLKTINDMLHDL